MNVQEKPMVFSVVEKLPPVDERVIGVTDTFRCLGYLGRDGVWRHANDRTEIKNVRRWYAHN
jgi:hypothetical protein